MGKFLLDNGLTVVFDERNTDSVAVELSVRVGASNEPERISGISHFLEHMLFEGTKKRPTARDVAGEIEDVGGMLNASTSHDRTAYVIKTPRKHYELSLDVLSDLMQNSLFRQKPIENNRKVILDEINLFNDNPLFYQWIMFYRELFAGTPIGNPVGGTAKSVGGMSRDDILKFFGRNYVTGNMVLSVVGGVRKNIPTVEKYFGSLREGSKKNKIAVKRKNRNRNIPEFRKINQSYLILGYRTVPRSHDDGFALDVIQAVLGRGESGWMFDEIRNKRGLAYNVGVDHEPELDYGMFAVSVGTKKKNVDKVVNIIQKNFSRLQKLTPRELSKAKEYLEGNRILDWEDNTHRADALCFYEHVSDCRLADEYLSKINSVSLADVKKAAEENFTDDYTLTLVQEEK